MPDDGHHDIDASALQSVVSIIKDMEVKVDNKFELFTRSFYDQKNHVKIILLLNS